MASRSLNSHKDDFQQPFTSYQIEFFAEDDIITIIPNFRMEKIVFLSGTYGPFEPALPTDVPLWLAINLKKKKKCKIQYPYWLSIGMFEMNRYICYIESEDILNSLFCLFKDNLQEKYNNENKSEIKFQEMHPHYIEISNLVLSTAPDDCVENVNAIRGLIEDISNRRQSKFSETMVKALQSVDVKSLSSLLIQNITQIEINRTRGVICSGFNHLQSISKIDNIIMNMTTTSPLQIFFRVKDRVKKGVFTGTTLDDLKLLFMQKFPEFPGGVDCPFYTIDKHNGKESLLDDVSVLQQFQEILVRHENEEDTKKRSPGYTGLDKEKIVLVMVGLPARGKTYVARKICRMLNWMLVPAKVFNVGEYRRLRIGAGQPHDFFDPSNPEGIKARLHMAVAALDDMISWLHNGGRVGIYDATNSTKERRQLVLSRCTREKMNVLFVESICNDQDVIEANIKETKLLSPDYQGADSAKAVQDFRERIKHYNKVYETVEGNDLQYIKLFDVGKKIEVNNITGYIPSRIVFFLMNLHIHNRPIWLTRHGESEFNATNKIGGDSDLTERGDNYAHQLAVWISDWCSKVRADGYNGEVVVWTSSLKRAIRTAQYISQPKVVMRALDEIDAGICDGMTYEEIQEKMPDERAARDSDKLQYRYPRGESYEDVIQRLEPLLLELERTKLPVLIVSHQATLRCLYSYLTGRVKEECPFLNIPLHTLIQLTPKAYGCEEKTFKLCN
ncbi:Fructose-6-phosphate-2-kinase/fructose-2 [Cavenderia fasciculata]|uniref:Fructose-6-phosphate-2-kinase/fructose-2 n=1 Tax=Cavenderia fasciculata TaxID=261658 RepID=F4Q3I5_CACFS|nr:Fructose-6-phosphate-2-kinase/fructose-2 [Cavenderia fasciculata]EGG17643.1 Fructose-6-phosphate-2-kinase/fructose-2 [Cavenderia fasciculata]|eukprot:XP_004356127.1 Fructose-6-phosphate-2-kinase/fructose-2 [Cavenderia fasciculata]